MNSENTVSLVKELEKINSSSSKNNYNVAWSTFGASIVFLIVLFSKSLYPNSGPTNVLTLVMFFVLAVLLMLKSFYSITNHINNKKFSIIIKSILDLEKK
jgi:predicted membrane channel-forming protein YqfA (hemolysin III family)